MTLNIADLTPEQKQKFLADLKAEEKATKKAQEKARKAYEKSKDDDIEMLFDEAVEIVGILSRFKQKVAAVMEAQKNKLDNYGSIRSDSKGGFSITHSDKTRQIKRRRDMDPVWDERAKKAVELLRSFLYDSIKKRDKEFFELLIGYLEKNKEGDWDYSSVMEFLKHENSFDDERWIEGIRLLKEGYSRRFKAFGYEFKKKDAHGKMVNLALNFATIV